MHDFDISLKTLFRNSAAQTFWQIAGVRVTQWLDVELPRIRNPRADLLGKTSDGGLLHVELQSANDPEMALRMAEYCLGIYAHFKIFPKQVLLYVGEPPMRMPPELHGEGFAYSYRQVDARDLDGGQLLKSPQIGDNVFAVLTNLRDQAQAVQQIIQRISKLDSLQREVAAEQLLILAGLRKLTNVVEKELERMPLTIDLMDNPVFARLYNSGRDQGRNEGLSEGLSEGLNEGRTAEGRSILQRQLAKRFGPLTPETQALLLNLTLDQIEDAALRLLDASSIAEVFQS